MLSLKLAWAHSITPILKSHAASLAPTSPHLWPVFVFLVKPSPKTSGLLAGCRGQGVFVYPFLEGGNPESPSHFNFFVGGKGDLQLWSGKKGPISTSQWQAKLTYGWLKYSKVVPKLLVSKCCNKFWATLLCPAIGQSSPWDHSLRVKRRCFVGPKKLREPIGRISATAIFDVKHRFSPANRHISVPFKLKRLPVEG